MKVHFGLVLLLVAGFALAEEQRPQDPQEIHTNTAGDAGALVRDKRGLFFGKGLLAKIGLGLGIGAIAAKTAVVGGAGLLALKGLAAHKFHSGYYGGHGSNWGAYKTVGVGVGHGGQNGW